MKDIPIKLHNTLTGTTDTFSSLTDHRVGMYHCGPTVYHYAHIGNLRSYILADTLRRMFEVNGYSVNQVINLTDVGHLTGDNLGDANSGEDRVEKEAKKEGKTAQEITSFYIDAFFKDLQALNIETEGTHFPKPTDHIPEQIKMIQELEAKDAVYRISDGMYFDTSKYPHYGKLGNINIEGQKEGARVESTGEKRNPSDFALWKFSPENEKRQQEWESPWGIGFPGWHIECSAMSMKYLGETFDVHTGGIDHIPVHHNNEIAQSELVTGKPFANYWLHNAFVNVNGGKIGKSLGTSVLLQEIIEKGYSPLDYRYLLLLARYSQQVNFTYEILDAARAARERLVKHASMIINKVDNSKLEYVEKFVEIINNDLDTPQLIAELWNSLKNESISDEEKLNYIYTVDKLTGLTLLTSAKELAQKVVSHIPENIMSLIQQRLAAREQKAWTTSDKLRDQINSLGYDIKDIPDSPFYILESTQ